MDTPPQGDAQEASPRIEAASAAGHLAGITGVLEITRAINVITGTVTVRKIKNRTETKRGTDTRDMGTTHGTETKTDPVFMNKGATPCPGKTERDIPETAL